MGRKYVFFYAIILARLLVNMGVSMAKEVEVIFEVEQELYDGVQKICKENGTTIEEVTRDFLCFCADPKNTPFLQRWFKNNEQ